MLYAILNEKRVTSLSLNETELLMTKKSSKNSEIICPDCKGIVHFRNNKIKLPHFYHKNQCTYPYGEPESETHIKGKIIICEYLKNLYPDAIVDLEYRIERTNQRSDVIVIHPNGEKWAFEFQCSNITDDIWLKRHELYKSAGVKDFWILNYNFLKSSFKRICESPNKENIYIFSLNALEKIINREQLWIYYLNTEDENFYIVGKQYENNNVQYKTKELFQEQINECKINNNIILNEELENYLIREKEENEKRELKRIKENAEKEIIRIKEKEKQEINIKLELENIERLSKSKIIELESLYKNYNLEREKLFNTLWRLELMSEKESKLFEKLCLKHGFNKENYPPFLNLKLNFEYIKVNHSLWQLWIYDKFIHSKNKMYLPTIVDELIANKEFKLNKEIIWIKKETLKKSNRHAGYYRGTKVEKSSIIIIDLFKYMSVLLYLRIILSIDKDYLNENSYSLKDININSNNYGKYIWIDDLPTYYCINITKIPIFNNKSENILLNIGLDKYELLQPYYHDFLIPSDKLELIDTYKLIMNLQNTIRLIDAKRKISDFLDEYYNSANE